MYFSFAILCTNLLQNTHGAIITQISLELKEILPFLEIPDIILNYTDLSEYGDDIYLEYVLERELSRQFVTYKQLILIDLLSYVRNVSSYEYEDNVELYGTRSFNLVWEHICKINYQDDLDKKLIDLNLRTEGIVKVGQENTEIKYNSNSTLRDVVEKPIWREIQKNSEDIEVNKSLELDVLHVNNTNRCFEIFDSKYYTIKFTKEGIKGQPGVGDITKQYLYQLAYKKLAEINGFGFTNTFIVPMDDLNDDNGEGVMIATVHMEMLEQLKLSKIKVIARDCYTFYEEYLNERRK